MNIQEIKDQSQNKPWEYLLCRYLQNIELFYNEYTITEYLKNSEALLATKKLNEAIKQGDQRYILDLIDHWGVTCFEFFKSKWLESEDIKFNESKAIDRVNWSLTENYSWEN